MLEPPPIPESSILSALQSSYGIHAHSLAFLPLGADVNTAVYRAETGGAAYFLKLRKGAFDDTTVRVPRFLQSQGVPGIIAPLAAQTGQPYAALDPYTMILYPFVVGKDGYELALTPLQWRAFGAALRGVHAAELPPDLARRIPREDFSPVYRDMVRGFQAQAAVTQYDDPTAAKLAAFLRDHRAVITRLVERTDALAALVQSRGADFVLCHNDIHPGNLHLTVEGALYMVDWDNPLFAPRERDLALVGGSAYWSDPEGVAAFYHGYGDAPVDPDALTYYRYERILTDIGAFCKQLLLTTQGGADREQSYIYCTSSFRPGGDLEIAARGDAGERRE